MMIADALAKQLLDAAPDPCIVIDSAGRIRYVSARVEDVLGYKPQELADRRIEALVPSRLRDVHVRHRAQYFDDVRPRPMGTGLDLYAVRKDGTEIPVEISLNPVETADGTLVSAAIRDVSRQKELERQLVEASRAKSRFLAAASHDLRQPVQTLDLLNAVARRTVADDAHKEIIAKQQRSLDSIARLLNSLLDISKLDAGIVQPDIRDFAVQEVFEELRAEFDEQARSKGLELVVEPCHGVAKSDPGLLSQIMGNLVSNALRYTHEGLVRLRCLHEDTFIRLEVLDTGLGMPAEELDHIFEEFYRGGSGERHSGGLGLGLSIVKRTAQLLHHAVKVNSTPGQGSAFAISVPRGDKSRVSTVSTDETVVAPEGGGLILIVDDDVAVADATGMLLEAEGFEVLIAASASEAFECLSNRIPELVVCDYLLRGEETGIEVIHSLRKHAGRNVPAILVSGDTSGLGPSSAAADIGFVTKPVDTDALLRGIRQRIGLGGCAR